MTVDDGTFDSDAFLNWLEDQEGTIPGPILKENWPNFPWENCKGITVVLEDGDSQYFQRDLRRAARGYTPLD